MFEIDKMPSSIDIGYTGETCFRKIEIDMTAWMEKMPAGVPSIIAIRPWETKEDAYIAATTFADNILTWEITDADLGTEEGDGEIQVWLEEEADDTVTKRGKSIKIKTHVIEAVEEADENPPAPQQGWITQMTALKDAMENAASHGPVIDEETGNWKTWDAEEEEYEDTGVHAQGEVSRAELDTKADKIHDTVSNQSVANVPDACAGNVDELVLQLEPIQAGIGDPAPDNVRAISGRAAVVLKQSGADTSEYTDHTATIPTPPGTVYGGEIDWVNGKLKVTMALVSKKYSELNNGSGTTPEGYSIKSIDITSVLADYSIATSAVCNVAKYNASSNAQNVFRITSTGKYIYLTLPTSMDADAIVNVCYPLATLVEYDLAALPDNIELVFGENNVWIDNGKIKTMKYPCDTKLYIDKKVAELQALILDN